MLRDEPTKSKRLLLMPDGLKVASVRLGLEVLWILGGT